MLSLAVRQKILETRERTPYIEKPGAGRHVRDVFITYMHVPGTYILLDERLIDPWYLVSYYTVDGRRCKGRTWYNVPVVIESRTNIVCTAP